MVGRGSVYVEGGGARVNLHRGWWGEGQSTQRVVRRGSIYIEGGGAKVNLHRGWWGEGQST